jgi:uncharacterized DUF497 family protein
LGETGSSNGGGETVGVLRQGRASITLLHIVSHVFRCYINYVVISFDPAKRASNLAKHGIDLAESEQVLDGACESRVDDRFDYGEERWISVGLLRGEVVVCVWVETGDDEARIISLRKATRNEQEGYFGQIGR